VSGIIAAGIVPAALEMMDRVIVGAVEAAYGFGFPARRRRRAHRRARRHGRRARGAGDAVRRGLREQRRARGAGGARRGGAGGSVEEPQAGLRCRRPVGAELLHPGRRRAAHQACPRSCAHRRDGAAHRLRIANVFHAGDGNIHPIILYDERDADEVDRVLAAGREILEACVELGGSVTGEHGIGVEKIEQMPLLFSPVDLRVMSELRRVFDPDQRCNPGKIFPNPGACVEVSRPRRQVPL
jgi:glycolate oxidase